MRTSPDGKIILSSWSGDNAKDGLTKREEFAIQLMKNMVRRSSMQVDIADMRRFAEIAVSGADSLVEELNRKKS